MNLETFYEADHLRYEIQFLEGVKKSFESGKPNVTEAVRILLGRNDRTEEWNKEFYNLIEERINSHLKLSQEKFDSL